MEEHALFILIVIITSPLTFWAFSLMLRWGDFMSSLKVKSFLYTKLGLKFRMTERIGDFGACVIAGIFSIFTVVTGFFPTQAYEYITKVVF